jgi:MYXO-CTERM domain-containing protein
MKTLLTSLLGFATCLSLAQGQSFTVSLDPQQEADPVGGRTGTGIGNITLSGNTLTLNITFSGLSGTFSADHIHGPAAATPATTAGVLYGLQALTTTSDGGHAGVISGTVTLTAGTGGFDLPTQLAQLNSGMWYVNIHTSPNFAGGEIRGQILPVPEPSAWALGILAVGGLWLMRRRWTA